MKLLDRSDREQLLSIARHAIEGAVTDGGLFELDATAMAPSTREHAATFVSLHEGGKLRGCIGLMRFEFPMWMNVRDAAVAAALEDTRFLPVAASELPYLEIEISVLEPPVRLPNPADFRVGRQGIVVERGSRRGLMLPQVASEMGWGADQMLDAVCRKAALPGDAWRDPETRLFVFESYCFAEASIR